MRSDILKRNCTVDANRSCGLKVYCAIGTESILLHHYMQFLLTIYHCTAGVMAARGILNNPAMFAGYQSTPLQCVADWVSHRDHWSGLGFLGNLGHCRA